MNRRRVLLPLLLIAAFASHALESRAASPGVVHDLRMAQDSQPFRQAADEFIARSMAGDVAGTQSLLSRSLVERTGGEAVTRALQSQIVPFFQRGREPGRSVTIARTTDASGQQGFAFYMWMEYAEAPTARPFTVYVVREQGRLVVANIVPDRLVEGRHR
jgi:hypothetical protein